MSCRLLRQLTTMHKDESLGGIIVWWWDSINELGEDDLSAT